ncbi:MAG: universal stress protein [Acidimicrobiales bacterium]|jgi:nucleotide-binding universal stress UspA family protein
MTEAPTTPPIIAGVDGSPEAATALEFAIEEARLRKAPLHVTYAYAVGAAGVGSTSEEFYGHLEADAKALLERAAAAASSTDGLEVEWKAVPGNPSEVLVEASRDATLLVVGSRGLGGFMGLVMGSVSSQCVHHSHCPVLVVRKEH